MSNIRIVRTSSLGGLACVLLTSMGCDDCTEYALSPTTVEPAQDCLLVSAPLEQTDGCLSEGVTPMKWSTAFDVKNECAEALVVEGSFVIDQDGEHDDRVRFDPGQSGHFVIDNETVSGVEGAATRIRFPAKLGETRSRGSSRSRRALQPASRSSLHRRAARGSSRSLAAGS